MLSKLRLTSNDIPNITTTYERLLVALALSPHLDRLYGHSTSIALAPRRLPRVSGVPEISHGGGRAVEPGLVT